MQKDFLKWAVSERPPQNGLTAFEDCILGFKVKSISQVTPRSAAVDCYTSAPACICYRSSDSFQEIFTNFMNTTICGDEDLFNFECTLESLPMLGKRLPGHQAAYFGGGGNSKGDHSFLRSRCFGDSHQFVSPSFSDKSKDDEFRKQGHEFHCERIITMQEGAGFEVDETVWCAFSASASYP